MIPIIKPCMGEEEVQAASRAIRSGWVTQGPEVRAFEEEFAAFVGAPYACAVSNCTTALHLALRAAGVGSGDEVITVSHTFIATANSVRYLNAVPVFIDVEPLTFNMNPKYLEAALSPKTKAILCVHQMGMPCDLRKIAAFAKEKNLALIEDAACAMGSQADYGDGLRMIGYPEADAVCFSFHPRKIITTGDGGMITTRHRSWNDKFRVWRHNGMGISDEARHNATTVIFEEYPELGYNYRMTDIQAAVGREQLKKLPDIVSARRRLAERYQGLLKGIASVGLAQEPSWSRTNWQSFTVRLPGSADQRSVMQFMLDQGVATRRGIMCIHREPAYQTPGGYRAGSVLTESELAQDHSIILPLYSQMTEEEQDRVIQSFRGALSL